MAQAVMEIFDSTIHKTANWIDELALLMGWEDQRKTYGVLRAVLHSLRDQLTMQETVHLGAQLPLLIRGMFYEGWNPEKKPIRMKTREEFLNHLCSHFPRGCEFDPEHAVEAVFVLLSQKITQGEIEDLRQNFPKDLQDWWPKT